MGLHEFDGSTENNITMVSGPVGPLNVDAGHPAVFLDENPNAPAEGRFKAIFRSAKPNGLLPFQSADGFTWKPMTDAPILAGLGAYDSQNLAFWDPTIGKYRAYWRIFTAGVTSDKEWKPGGYRAIRTATSDDLVHWGPHTDLTYEDSPAEHLYTNQIKPYHRAPHLLEAFLRPGIERPGTWHYGHQYIGWHLVETKSGLPEAPAELSLYAGESYWTGKGSAVRRYSLRLDGFVSIQAPWKGGELITKPFTFEGEQLSLNFATSAAGSVRVEVQDADGKAIPGFELDACHVLFGDTVDRTVTWKGDESLASLQGRPVRLRFEVRDADLYAFQFTS
ncbi:Uncharacterized protein SCF082_LOCUS23776 [Durusdinium trenchii]|uniref:Beta-fructofuranosidase n=1 Tax=Durusdinium trenchii TaxID=1381693 RepID=A0ABP0LSR5_9DINO